MNYFEKNIYKAVQDADIHGFCASDTNQQVLFPSHTGGCNWTLEAVVGCTFKCSYCLAKICSMAFGELTSFDEWNNPKVKDNIIEIFDSELNKVSPGQYIWVCDLTDPFMYRRPDVTELHLKLIERMNNKGIFAKVLTKGFLPEELYKLSDRNYIGVSASILNDGYRKIYEKNTIPTIVRLKRLKQFNDRGFYTWVSIAPYPSPRLFKYEPIEKLLDSIRWANRIVFDAFGYFGPIKEEDEDFYFEISCKIHDFCEDNGIEFNNLSKIRELVRKRLNV